MSRRRTIIIVASSEAAPSATTQLDTEAQVEGAVLGSNVILAEGVKVTVEYQVPALVTNTQAAATVCRILDKLDGSLG